MERKARPDRPSERYVHLFTWQSLDELTDAAVPPNIKLERTMHLEKPYSE